jgi:hypothetical protein
MQVAAACLTEMARQLAVL